MRFVEQKSFSDPDVAERKLVEIANGVEALQDGRIYVERAIMLGYRATSDSSAALFA